MGRPALPPKPEEVASWRKRVEEMRSELFNKPCRKQLARILSSHVAKETEEEAFRGFLSDTFDLVTAKKDQSCET